MNIKDFMTMKKNKIVLALGAAFFSLCLFAGCANILQKEAPAQQAGNGGTYGAGNVEINISKPGERTLLPTLEGGKFDSIKVQIEWQNAVATNPTLTTLASALDAAYKARAAVKVDTDGTNTPLGSKWVLQADLNTFNAVINNAEAVYGNKSAIQAEVNAAAASLNTAVTGATAVFNTKTNNGAKNIRQALIDKLGDAYTKRANVVVNTAAANVYNAAKYVTTTNMSAINNAIKAAEDVLGSTTKTQADIDTAVNTLNNAINAFSPLAGTRTQYQPTYGGATTINAATWTNLLANINTAWAAKKGVVPAASAANVPVGVMFVTTARWNVVYQWSGTASSGAIQAAENNFIHSATYNPSTYATTWANTLNTALINTTTGFGAKNVTTGRYANFVDGTFVPDKTNLTNAIAAAYNAKLGVVIGTNANAVPDGVRFVSQAVMDALNAAIATAEGKVFTVVIATEVTTALNAMTGATTTFNGVKNNAANVGTYKYTGGVIDPVYIPGDAVRYIADIPAAGQWKITVTGLKSTNPDVALISGGGIYDIAPGYNPSISVNLNELAAGSGTLSYHFSSLDALPSGAYLDVAYGPVDRVTGLAAGDAFFGVPGVWSRVSVIDSNEHLVPLSTNDYYGFRLILTDPNVPYPEHTILVDEVVHIYSGLTTEADYNVQKLIEGPKTSGYEFTSLGDETITWNKTMWGNNNTITIVVPEGGVWSWYVDEFDVTADYYNPGTRTFTITKTQLLSLARPGPNHITALVNKDGKWTSKRVYFLLDN
jgi:hypothetical protein